MTDLHVVFSVGNAEYTIPAAAVVQLESYQGATPVPGTADEFQKYLQLAPTGQFADSAKGMLASMDAKVDTAYKNPNAPAPKKKK